jgi:hypothetical protein
MQDRLFDEQPSLPTFNEDHDPYADVRAAGQRIAEDYGQYGIDVEKATDMVLAYGSEAAARRELDSRWWKRDRSRAA